MPIEFRCPNVSQFDSTRGKYVQCNQLLRVSSKRAGDFIQCPKCSQDIEVPLATTPLALDPVRASKMGAEGGASDSVSKAGPSKKSIMDLEFESETPAASLGSSAYHSAKSRCPKCGGRFSSDGICTLCNFVEPVQKAERQFAENKPAKPAGFQLWLRQLSSNGDTMTYVGLGLSIFASLFLCILIVLGIVSTSLSGVALAVTAAFSLVYLFSIIAATWRLAKKPEAGLGTLGPIWNCLLVAARYLDWQKYDSRFAGRKIIDLRKTPTTDSQLPAIDGLQNCQVLDLEGSAVTDAGLSQLYGHLHLRCLVLRNTEVTPTGVARLQQAIPRLWIWY